MNKPKPIFIAVCGADGSGKTTIINHLDLLLKQNHHHVKVGQGFGSGNLGSYLRKHLFANPIAPDIKLEVFSFLAALSDCEQNFVLPNLKNGDSVILDRYIPSFVAYQLYARELTKSQNINATTESIVKYINGIFLTPTFYIHCVVDPEVGLKRTTKRTDNNYMDAEKLEFHTRVSRGYESFFTLLPVPTISLDCNQPIEEVKKQLERKLIIQQVIK